MNKSGFAFRLVTAATAALLAWSSSARAEKGFDPELVSPMDTFSFSVVAFNTSPVAAENAVAPDDVTFGTTGTTTGLGGSVVTYTSSESVGATTTTDTITVSTPTNFAPVGDTINGTAITGLRFQIGEDNKYGDPVNLALSTASYSDSGSTIYGTGNTTASLSPTTTLLDGNTAYQMAENVTNGGNAVNSIAFHSFTYVITYSNLPVPEPSALALSGLGLIGCAVGAVRRRRG
jgi:hypothetical protein